MTPHDVLYRICKIVEDNDGLEAKRSIAAESLIFKEKPLVWNAIATSVGHRVLYCDHCGKSVGSLSDHYEHVISVFSLDADIDLKAFVDSQMDIPLRYISLFHTCLTCMFSYISSLNVVYISLLQVAFLVIIICVAYDFVPMSVRRREGSITDGNAHHQRKCRNSVMTILTGIFSLL